MTKTFLEGKTVPYHVQIDLDKMPLAPKEVFGEDFGVKRSECSERAMPFQQLKTRINSAKRPKLVYRTQFGDDLSCRKGFMRLNIRDPPFQLASIDLVGGGYFRPAGQHPLTLSRIYLCHGLSGLYRIITDFFCHRFSQIKSDLTQIVRSFGYATPFGLNTDYLLRLCHNGLRDHWHLHMYLFSLIFAQHFRYNVLRSGANHTQCDGSRGTNEVSPSVKLMLSKKYPYPRRLRG